MIVNFLFTIESKSAHPMSLNEAIEHAVKHSPQAHIFRKEHEIKELELKNAKAHLLPSVDLVSEHGIEKLHPKSGTDPFRSAVKLTFTETLYDHHVSIDKKNIAALELEKVSLLREKLRDELSFKVLKQFIEFSKIHNRLLLFQDQLAEIERQFKVIKNQYTQGLRPRKDFLRLKADSGRARIKQEMIRYERDVSLLALFETIYLDGSHVEIIPFVPKLMTSTPSIPPIEKTFDHQINEIQRKINEIKTSFEKRKNGLTLDISTSAFFDYSNYLRGGGPQSPSESYGWNILLGLKYNLLDFGIQRRKAAVSSAQELIENHRMEQESQSLKRELSALSLTLGQMVQRYKDMAELVKIEEETYRSIAMDYEEGKIPYLDYQKSLNDLHDSKNNFYEVQYELFNESAKCHLYEGTLYEKSKLF